MPSRVHIDIETFSHIDLKKAGMFRYAEDPSTKVLCLCWAVGAGPVNCWVPLEDIPKEAYPRQTDGGKLYLSLTIPGVLLHDLFDADRVSGTGAPGSRLFTAHNSQFERTILNASPGARLQFPKTKREQWVCTAAKVSSAGLPRALENAANALGSHPKQEFGRMDMLALCKLKKGQLHQLTPFTDPLKYRGLFEYCIDDVRAERDIDFRLPDLSPREQQIFILDQKINDHGVKVDTEGLANVSFLVEQRKAELADSCVRATGGIRPTQTGQLADWIRGQGYQLADLQKATVSVALKDPLIPSLVKKVLAIRSTHAMKAVSKYEAMHRALCSDERLRGMFLYYGAGTGRWSSLIVQLQNLYRGAELKINDEANHDDAVAAYTLRDIEWIRTLWGFEPMRVFASTVRTLLIAGEGHDLLCLDYAQIEARIIAWLAGEEKILEVFRTGGDVYVQSASGIYKVALKEVTSEQRFIGKIAILALGYQGGKKAFAKMAKNYGQDIDEKSAEKIKQDWRAANKKIVKLWRQMEDAAVAAVEAPGKVFGVRKKKIMFKVEGEFLFMRLPSGRRLSYFKPRLDDDNQVTYLGIDTITRQWGRVKTYGGKLTENAVQAIAADMLREGMLRLDKAGYPLIGTVHDEVLMEPAEDFGSIEEASQLMCVVPAWAEGLPIDAEGFRAKRYRK